MSIVVLPLARQATGFSRKRLSPRFMQKLTYTGQLDDELWSLLDSLSEVKEIGVVHMIKNGVHKDQSKFVYKFFAAHIRQAKNYYYAAKTLPPKSSSLLYYYSFLNLSKAFLVMKNPQLTGSKLRHGLQYEKTESRFKDEKIKIHSSSENIFPYIYKEAVGRDANLEHLNISRMFAYCGDIGYQYSFCGLGDHKLLPCYFAVMVNKDNYTGWGLVAIGNCAEFTAYNKTFKQFLDVYEEISIDQRLAREIFNLDASEIDYFKFFQTKNVLPWVTDSYPPEFSVTSEIKRLLGGNYQPNYCDQKFDFFITLPYSKSYQEPINELIAIYSALFYLSSLVRYRPDYLEKLYLKKDMWIIDNFVKFCPTTLLRSMVPLITGTDYVLTKR